MKLYLFVFISFIVFTACNQGYRKQDLQKERAVLRQKEQELLLKEKALALKEEELMKREQKLDSSLKLDTLRADTTHSYQPPLKGMWQVKMTCTETTCAGSAVGDTKTEQWEFSYQGATLIAKAMAGDKLLRVYTGLFTGSTAELEDLQSTASQPATKMTIRLRIINETSMDGQREIVRDGDCKVVYALQMEKQS